MITLNNTNIILLVAVVAMVILVLYSGESYKDKNVIGKPLFDVMPDEEVDMDNKDYKLGDFYFSKFSPQYQRYNAYKADPSKQPITLPSVDYNHEFESTLSKKCNPMYAIPEAGSIYVNVLNAGKNY